MAVHVIFGRHTPNNTEDMFCMIAGVNVVSAVRTDSAPTPPASSRFVKNCSVPPNVVLWTKPAFYCIKETPQMDEVLRLFNVAIHTSLSILRKTIVDVSD
ncbi:hypothetical protein DPMN_007556 [Dreissena polymorpha]|uniref:Uncharacterized protein n=1 Tax=Dreissena polymorpha TaxID=45954 RepID=A0A9D4MW24_DREPO|nr:hypothetical protein DPMN_007556 [Dreissena polymorpha]